MRLDSDDLSDEVQELVRWVSGGLRRSNNREQFRDFAKRVALLTVDVLPFIEDHNCAAWISLHIVEALESGAERDRLLEEARTRMQKLEISEKGFYTLSHKIIIARKIAELSGNAEDAAVRASLETKSSVQVCGC